jgi:CspA family cold shock protein
MSETSSLTERYTGRVKWFNSKTGYGFVTITDGPKSGTDVFVHHSSVRVEKEQYRYLVYGEYIQFELSRMSEGPHEFQASNVTGVNCGQLMCESLLESGHQIRSYRPRTNRSETSPRSELPPPTVERRVLPSQSVEKRRQPVSEPRSVRVSENGRGGTSRGRGGEGRGSGRGGGRGRGRA